MRWRSGKHAANGRVGSHKALTFPPARKDRMNGPPSEPMPPAPPASFDTPVPGAETMRQLGHGPMEGLQVYFLMRAQLKHCSELAKAMDDPTQDVKHLAGAISRAAARFAGTAQEFAMLNGEK